MEEKSRSRGTAIYDKKIIQIEDEDLNEIKKEHDKKNSFASKLPVNINASKFPNPPTHSKTSKEYESDESFFLNEKAFTVKGFEKYDTFDSVYSTININNFLSKFSEEELESLNLDSIFGCDIEEYKSIEKKLEELKNLGKNLKDKTISEFFKNKIKELAGNMHKMQAIVTNIDKVEDFIILNETLKFFIKKK